MQRNPVRRKTQRIRRRKVREEQTIRMSDREKGKAPTLSSLLEEDKDSLLSQLEEDRSREHASQVLEKEADRLMLRFSQLSTDEWKLEAGQNMLQTVKSSLPMVESVTDAEIWTKEEPALSSRSAKMNLPALITTVGGAALTLVPAISRPASFLYTVAGAAALALGGFLFGRSSGRRAGMSGRKAKDAVTASGSCLTGGRGENSRVQLLVDPGAAYHGLQRMLLTADHLLENMRQPSDFRTDGESCLTGGDGFRADELNGRAGGVESALSSRGIEKRSGAGRGVSDTDLVFYSELLENAYASRRRDPDDPALTEQIESIRYYLHKKGISAEDYTGKDDEGRFEFLPSGGRQETIRPALLSGSRVLKKGLASV